mmetsp:Transcript_4413/g.9567  ORF Transcript_4413/g.9567 Transcript_4413/m.9567 type:complete len:208 (+) Transcript_4413:226-849(+)
MKQTDELHPPFVLFLSCARLHRIVWHIVSYRVVSYRIVLCRSLLAQVEQFLKGPLRGLVFAGRIVVVAIDQCLGGPRLALGGDRVEDVVVDGHVQEAQVLQEVFSPLQCRQFVPAGVTEGIGVLFEDRRRLGPAVPQRCLRQEAPDAVPFFFPDHGGGGVQLGQGLGNEGPHFRDVGFGVRGGGGLPGVADQKSRRCCRRRRCRQNG